MCKLTRGSMGHPLFIAAVVLAIAALAVFAVVLVAFLWITVARSPATTSKKSLGRSAAVVVLGDVGRSPRMCFHAQSLAEDGWRVAVVGYQGAPLPPPLRRSSVRVHYVVQPFERMLKLLPRTGGLFALLTAPLKLVGQSFALFWILSTQVQPPPELIIVQTPPALPTLFIVRLVGMLLGSRLIIDWHNFGYSILALRFSPTSAIVKLAYHLERLTGRRAFAHLCVTNALRQHLIEKWQVRGPVRVLYDRPPSHYRKTNRTEMQSLFQTVLPTLSPSIGNWTFVKEDGSLADDRPALVVSSTSWTADEDFGMLLRAASLYEKRAQLLHAQPPSSPVLLESPQLGSFDLQRLSSPSQASSMRRAKNRRVSVTEDALPKAVKLPKMLIIVTGKGELRDQYVAEIARLEREEKWQWVRIRTAWLPIETYPTLLGAADVGVSLHSSSSGMDLPMKVVDMLGCGTTVCALGFPCIDELVQHGKNGLVFYSDKQLAQQLESLLADHPEPSWLASITSRLASLFPEDVPASTSPSGGSPRSHSPPPDVVASAPSSPLPTFTLLQSPVQAKFDVSVTQPDALSSLSASKARNWSGNWKRVVRPLILAADLQDSASKGRLSPPSSSSPAAKRRTSGEGFQPSDGVRHRQLLYDDPDEVDAPTSARLRQRTTAALQAPANIDSNGIRIPGIQISAPSG